MSSQAGFLLCEAEVRPPSWEPQALPPAAALPGLAAASLLPGASVLQKALSSRAAAFLTRTGTALSPSSPKAVFEGRNPGHHNWSCFSGSRGREALKHAVV